MRRSPTYGPKFSDPWYKTVKKVPLGPAIHVSVILGLKRLRRCNTRALSEKDAEIDASGQNPSMSLMDELVVVDAGGERSFSPPAAVHAARVCGRPCSPSARAGEPGVPPPRGVLPPRARPRRLPCAGVDLALLARRLPRDEFNVALLVSLPLVVVVSKIVGLYDRDDLLLNKTHARRGAAAAPDLRPVRARRVAAVRGTGTAELVASRSSGSLAGMIGG